MTPDKNVQLIVALFGELMSSTSATRRLLVVSVCKKEREDMDSFVNDLFIVELFVGEKRHRDLARI